MLIKNKFKNFRSYYQKFIKFSQNIRLKRQNNFLSKFLKNKKKNQLINIKTQQKKKLKKVRKHRKHRTRKSISNAVIETGKYFKLIN